MRNKKNDANGFYLCISDLVVDGVLMCTAGKRYRIQDAESGPGEAPAEAETGEPQDTAYFYLRRIK